MKNSSKPIGNLLLLVFAGIGICAAIFGVWRLYEQKSAERARQAAFGAPPNPNLPNPLFGTPAAPPPQP